MRLSDLVDALPEGGDAAVTGFAIDHRKVAPGTIFGAFRGARFNGEDFIQAAVADGALAVVARPEGATVLLTRRADTLASHTGQIAFPGDRLAQFTISYASESAEQFTVAGTEGEITAQPCFGFGPDTGIDEGPTVVADHGFGIEPGQGHGGAGDVVGRDADDGC